MAQMPGMQPQLNVWSIGYLLPTFVMWTIMMVAMMLPSAAPMILLFARVSRRAGPRLNTMIFVGSYLLVWTLFSAFAALAQAALISAGALSDMTLMLGSAAAAGVMLVAVGLYQLSPLKEACLEACRSPLSFVMRLWRPGVAGTLRLGFAHGVYCLGCCWGLMLLLFVGGVMNLAWIAALAVLVLVEKTAPISLRKAISALLLSAGAVMILGAP
jgi:predicted metal-binding membrane protein